MGNRAKAAVTKAESKSNNSISEKQKSDSFKSINSPVDYILYLQRTIGNQAVQKLFKFGAIQSKPRINQPGDTYEQEADRKADEVMRMPKLQMHQQEKEKNDDIYPKSIAGQITQSVHRQAKAKEKIIKTIECSGQSYEASRNVELRRQSDEASSQVGCWLTRESHITSGALRRREATTPSRRTLPNTIQLQPTPSSTTSRTIPPKLDKQTVVGPMDTIDCGGYYWGIRWKLDRPTKKGGYVVQMVGSWVNVKDCRGRPVRVQDRVKEYNPRNYPFWEAWKIGRNQTGTGKHIDDSYWWLQGVGEGTKGFMQVLGYANYYDGLVLPSSFKVDKNSPARLAPMTKTNPNLTGGSGPVLHTLKAEWNCCPDSASKKTKLTPK